MRIGYSSWHAYCSSIRDEIFESWRSGVLMRSDSVLTSDEAIQYLRISKPTFLKYIRLGRIKAIKAGKGWRVLHSELYRFLKEGSPDGVSLTADLNEDQNTDCSNKNIFD
jgi:excisionase family DNA binding protein